MPERPNFRFHRSPRFSANQLADYMNAGTASQRETVLRAAKFPRASAVIPYTATRQILAEFLPNQKDGMATLDENSSRLEARLRREPDGWMQDELKRNIEALKAFKAAHLKCKLGRLSFAPGPADLLMNVGGVRLNTRLDARLLALDDDGQAFGGGLVLFLAGGAQSRKNIEDRLKTVAALVHWTLETLESNIEALPKLCMSFDVFGQTLTKAPTAIDRLRANVQSSCREAANTWPGVEPPSGYDGPDWR